jgi:hypothetical protein
LNTNPYAPILKTEVLELAQWLQNDIMQIELPKSLYDTKVVCRCFVVSICDVISGAFGALEAWSTTSYDIICRSLLEEVVDLKYLALSNSVVLNRRFANYHKLTQYWIRSEIQSYKDEIPRMEAEYYAYASVEFASELNPKRVQNKESGISLIKFSEIDKVIKDKYSRHWSGQSFIERTNLVRKHSIGSVFLERLNFLWKFLSNSTHPTVYSMIPHFNPSSGGFEQEYSPTTESMQDYELRLYLFLEVAAEAFYCTSVERDGVSSPLIEDGPTRYKQFQKLQTNKPHLMKQLFSAPKA